MSLAAAIATARSAQQAALEQAHAATITLSAIGYACAVSAARIQRVETTHGWQQQQTVHVSIRKTLLPSQPEIGEKLTYDGQVYDIEDVGGTKVEEIAWTLTCRRWIKR